MVDLDYKKFITTDKKYLRPTEIDELRGDYSKAKKILGWKPKTNLRQLAKIMLKHDLKMISSINAK